MMADTAQYAWIMFSRLVLVFLYAYGLTFLYDSKTSCLLGAMFVVIYSDIIAVYRLTAPLNTKEEK